MTTKRTLSRQLADARAQIRRLADAREDAVGTAGTEHFNVVRLAKQLAEAREENDALRRRLEARLTTTAPADWAEERSVLRRALVLCERARASLDAQCRQLGAVNDRMNRELHDRAEVAG
ncbi:hypothetical protein [Streptomyces sp. NRRL F-5123]|uniref:hypothetical protein n=1 Tax=Streptomyces sp. NRRL F-5123 TaxID=1463856 RepID=UPI000AD903EE|nr:hypothetical protein [Streptomyces sp. NRRL F-5123]